MSNLSSLFKKVTQFGKKGAPALGALYNNVPGAKGGVYRMLPEFFDIADDIIFRDRAVPTARLLTGRNDAFARTYEAAQILPDLL